jgi:hypothetical protein
VCVCVCVCVCVINRRKTRISVKSDLPYIRYIGTYITL